MQKLIASLLLVITALLGALFAQPWLSKAAAGPVFDTPYQAVLLNNGQVYFGRLEGADGAFPVLREVYYLVACNACEATPNASALPRYLVESGSCMGRGG